MRLLSDSDFARATGADAPLADGEIHLWQLTLAPTATPREISAASRAFVGEQLARYAGLDDAPQIVVGEHGKPHAPAAAGVEFNLSHARERVLVAFARGQALGVDIERVDRRLALDDLARRFFAADESDALERIEADDARRLAFLRLWTSKEAVLKAIGAGISFGLDRIAFAIGPGGWPSGLARVAAEAGAREDWRLVALEPAPGFVGALAWRGAPRAIRTFARDDA